MKTTAKTHAALNLAKACVSGGGWRFDNSYARLPERFYTKLSPSPVAAPQLVIFNASLAQQLGLDCVESNPEMLAHWFSGNVLPAGAEPLAQAYAGHQFGHFTILGDGRAHLIGEQITPAGARLDIQLKGSGPTPYSRRGDGRAGLGPMLREYIISEAMHALGIPTTRSLAVVTTGEPVMRETMLHGAILTRVAASHIRVGTFEFFAAQEDFEGLKILADYTIARHYPELAEAENPYLALLQAVSDRQAMIVAKWLGVGFIHGVMNTDNMALSGETIDYGPCAFMDAYDPATVFSSIDRHGRYAYANQPSIAQWNIARFAEALLPLLHPEIAQAVLLAEEIIKRFAQTFQRKWLTVMRKKLGLGDEEAADKILIENLLQLMHRHAADYTNTLQELMAEALPQSALYYDAAFKAWHGDWQERRKRGSISIAASVALMHANNPVVIPRNHQVEAALTAAQAGDLTILNQLLDALRAPYEDRHEFMDYRVAPPSPQAYQTFCGT